MIFDTNIINPRIVLVTDRDDLDKQLGNTFVACGLDAKRAKSGRDLLKLVSEKKAGIITTLIHKFDKARIAEKYQDDSKFSTVVENKKITVVDSSNFVDNLKEILSHIEK